MTTIFAASDTHGAVWARIRLSEMDAVLFAGDLINGAASPREDGMSAKDAQAVELAYRLAGLPSDLTAYPGPVLAVRGNHDVGDPSGFFGRSMDLTGGGMHQLDDGLFVAGLGWSGGKYYDLPRESDLEPICRLIERQADRRIGSRDRLILLTHYPPALEGVLEQTPGCTYACVGDLVKRLRPIAVVFGHVHSWFGQAWSLAHDSAATTMLLSPGPAGMVMEIEARGQITHRPIHADPDGPPTDF
ncbi:MAG: metallophosphoesterase [Phycisphaeraceae bacterium]|nr:metallophosphoesterase [Phycisphaeraceae bacterium]